MYIRINISKTDFIYLKIWCDSHILSELFLLALYIYIYVVRKANNTTFNIYNPSLLDKPALMA